VEKLESYHGPLPDLILNVVEGRPIRHSASKLITEGSGRRGGDAAHKRRNEAQVALIGDWSYTFKSKRSIGSASHNARLRHKAAQYVFSFYYLHHFFEIQSKSPLSDNNILMLASSRKCLH